MTHIKRINKYYAYIYSTTVLHVCANFSRGKQWCASQCWRSPTQHTTTLAFEWSPYSRRICYIYSSNVCFVVRSLPWIFECLRYVCSLFPHSADWVESVLMTGCYVPFHSLSGNGIGQEGYSALTAALQKCKQLQVLKWVSNDVLLILLTVILTPQLTTYVHIVLHIMWNTKAAKPLCSIVKQQQSW